MEVLVTGASGLVGQALCRELLDRGHSVRILIRKTSFPASLWGLVTVFEGDVLDLTILEKAMAGADAVLHAAAIVSFSPRDRKQLMKVNVEGTTNAVNLALALGIKRFGLISSVAALGRVPGQTVVDESAEWTDSSLNSPYAISKFQAEAELWRAVQEGLSGFAVNPSVIFGPGDWNRSSSQIFQKVYRRSSHYPEGTINYVDLRDVAAFTVRLLESKASEERFILSGGMTTYQDLFTRIANGFGKPVPQKRIPQWVLELGWRWGVIQKWFGRDPVLTRSVVRSLPHRFAYRNEKAQAATGLKFRSLDETITWSSTVLKKMHGL